jgi:ABC-type arginine transport system ATPase subunit
LLIKQGVRDRSREKNMQNRPETVRIFISSPGDVAEERSLVRRVIERLQGEFTGRALLEPIFWEHEPLRATASWHEQILSPSEADIVICILWSRLGTRQPAEITRPDGSRYHSGTEYEFEEAWRSYREQGQPDLLVYRKTRDPRVSLRDKDDLMRRLEQKEALDRFIDTWFQDREEGTLIAAYHPFDSSDDFEELVEVHLRKLLEERLPNLRRGEEPKQKIWKEGSPFRGLKAFDFDHAEIFFGRTRATSEVLEALRVQAARARPFVLVLGMSGCGKSSLVRAGVLPLLTQPGVIEGVGLWRWAVMRPSDAGGDLFAGLATALLKEEALPELGADRTGVEELAALLRESPDAAFPLLKGGLSQAAAELARAEGLERQPEARLALVVDQLEELFISTPAGADREKFVEALRALVASGRVWVLATLRSDFYPRSTELPALVELKEGSGQYDLLPPTAAEIGQMIRRPARLAGLSFEEREATGARLDDTLRDAAAQNPEALPLLQFTLEELYSARSDQEELTCAA